MAEDVHQPLAVYRYRLTTVDAFAYERLPGEWTSWQKVAFILPLMAIGAAAGFFEEWPGIWWWPAFGGLALASVLVGLVGLVVYNWCMHLRAKAKAAREGQTEVEEWGDHLAIRSQSGESHLAYEMIGKVIATESQVFVLYPGGELIVPLRAFESAYAMKAFGEAVDRRSIEASHCEIDGFAIAKPAQTL